MGAGTGRTPLRAGPLRMTLEDGDLRVVRAGAVEVVRRLSMAVRDTEWATIPPRPRTFDVEQDGDGFRVAFRSRHVGSGIDLSWTRRSPARPTASWSTSWTGPSRRTATTTASG